ncbi:MAG: hypothetical protein N2510_07365, partial [Ignavibacteria bacterium]|nr:hypothetical protein [Ignavibacteria bacterium]
MLKVTGAGTLDELIRETVPDKILLEKELNLGKVYTEQELLIHLKQLASENKLYKTYIGYGYYGTYTPTVI